MGLKPLPIGIEDFKDLIHKGYYYVDKSLLIKELLDYKGAVNLFTRPRRFGKTLNLSMLQYFFEKSDVDTHQLFRDLDIMKEDDIYLQHMGKHPVIFLSLKNAKQASYELSVGSIKRIIAREFRRHGQALKNVERQKKRINEIMEAEGELSDYLEGLLLLSENLFEYYGKKVIILIDEYDVPLENAYFKGFYNEMLDFIRALFESALKTNPYLEFAVITGCLRISRESIFTGFNNLEIISMTSKLYAEHFGFNKEEVSKILKYYGIKERMEEAKTWYDGYYFGDKHIYNPWSLINYAKSVWIDEHAFPAPYWSNTSSNTIIKTLIERADASVKQEIEHLIAGGSIEKPIYEDLTYADIENSQDSVWNFLFFTGYLKNTKEFMSDKTRRISLSIPNQEVQYIYETKIIEWFQEQIAAKDFSVFYRALMEGDIEELQKELNMMLRESISFYDHKETFYHGFLLGLLKGMDKKLLVDSNREAGDGRYDIQMRSLDVEAPAILIELKVAEHFSAMEEKAKEALEQIKVKKYSEVLHNEGYQNILHYGIAFYKKNCRIKMRN